MQPKAAGSPRAWFGAGKTGGSQLIGEDVCEGPSTQAGQGCLPPTQQGPLPGEWGQGRGRDLWCVRG